MKAISILIIPAFLLILFACKKKEEVAKNDYKVFIRFKFDEIQERLDNFGQPSTISPGNAAQTPRFNKVSAHYIEFIENQFVQIGEGYAPYHAPEKEVNGEKAVDFDQSILVSEMVPFISLPLSSFPNGSYEYIRVSLSYQNYDIDLRSNGYDLTGTLASFVAFNSFISNFNVKEKNMSINDARTQGFWAFEVDDSNFPVSIPLSSGLAPQTTVPNPISQTSPIPAGSCVVTGKFSEPFVVSDDINKNIFLTLSLSVNNSFEWEDINGNGIFEPNDGENVVDMGLRGLIPIVE